MFCSDSLGSCLYLKVHNPWMCTSSTYPCCAQIKMSVMPGDDKKKGKEDAKAKSSADSGRQKGGDDRKGNDREKAKQSA